MKSFDKLKEKLAELFQLDQADLDFGIYRIMNARRDEILQFLDQDLLPQVRDAFLQYKSSDKAELQKELEKVLADLKNAGVEPETAPKVQELRKVLAEDAVDISAMENEVYDHLYNFFSRYYDEGDFISLRRYKEGVYAIPYEGEEVKLHWANSDQYYIKTTENFRDYAFKTADGHRVHFKIVEADTEKDNIKAGNGNDRRFILCGDQPVKVESNELFIRFEYKPDPDRHRQDANNTDTVEKVIANLNDEALAPWQHRLNKKARKADGTESDRTLLEKHLTDYTKRNTFDYFIHKDLGGFLRRELVFYIKNEVMRLDDIEEETVPRVKQYLSKIKVIRQIAHKIIDFLAQIENFQKKLWLKKKFVIETNYCITLDRVPEELYPEIAANEVQREEWVRLFAIDEIKGDLGGGVDYSEPLTAAFLKANPFLLLDTRMFNSRFKAQIVASLNDLEENVDGVVIHSENFQALNLLRSWSSPNVKCAYLDPPYNTSEETFVYKNEFRHSSWMSMMGDRITLLLSLFREDGALILAIDDEELYRLKTLTDYEMGEERYIGTIAVQTNPRGRGIHSFFATSHDYYLFYAANPEKVHIVDQPLTEDQMAGYRHEDDASTYRLLPFRRSGGLSTPDARPNSEFSVYYSPVQKRILGVGGPRIDSFPEPYAPEYVISIADVQDDPVNMTTIEFEQHMPADTVIIMPVDSTGQRRVWRWSDREKIVDHARQGDFVVQTSTSGYTVQLKDRIKEGRKPKTMWFDSKYDGSSHGTNLVREILGDRGMFGYPKSLHSTRDALHTIVGADDSAMVIDVFGGSGTTGHAVIELNRIDEGSRRYILAEMGDYFATVLIPRLQKVVYSKDWKGGKPVARDGISHMFKYLRLESYEDALANIALKRTEQQELALGKSEIFRESYMLRYLLDSEATGSQTLLNIDQFDDPFSYKLLVGTGSVGETKLVNVDLVETFNWLLGLKVRHMSWTKGYQIVEGESPQDEKVLIIWRKIRDLSKSDTDMIAAAREKSHADLEDFFRKQQYNTLDSEFDLIYVNGDNNLMNIPLDPAKEGVEPRYKVRLIEEEFKRLMFDVQDV